MPILNTNMVTYNLKILQAEMFSIHVLLYDLSLSVSTLNCVVNYGYDHRR